MNINLDIKEHEIETLRTAAEAKGWPIRKYVTYLVRAALIGGADVRYRIEPLAEYAPSTSASLVDAASTREVAKTTTPATREEPDPLTAAFNAVERYKRQVVEYKGELQDIAQRQLAQAEARLAKLRA